MAKVRRLTPQHPQMFRAHVVRTERISPSMQRVTVTGPDLGGFPWLGYDHWFRLFFPLSHQRGLRLPEFRGSQWWQPYLAIPEEERPHCANYSVADYRSEAAELDIDFVVHRGPTGEIEGRAAIWACAARPGDALALLDQGVLFDCPPGASEVTVVADETGLPATASIMRSLPEDTVGRLIQEIPTDADRRALDAPAGVTVSWVVRRAGASVPGAAALRELRRLTRADAAGYAFVVGESTLATEGRRHLHRLGLPKERITFSGFWKHEAMAAA
ncbi:siderophore-interacting protein [Streptomyces sp. NRRL F-4707]|uniref:siderophore-interacting protein n=1 Tax=unclassified Streptomyces TaxID=2593676 RepID=UPI0006ADBFAD|nr:MULTISPECIES: siderophore-interacting protein [unclassified Streptomyces]KOX26705.1 siderophore-interacting protein [Streptomyces sp. NRRL F-4707]KOX46423.1 siderophore-interacting protein [Streptomyces sp. NRRL F-7442]